MMYFETIHKTVKVFHIILFNEIKATRQQTYLFFILRTSSFPLVSVYLKNKRQFCNFQ